LVGEISAFKGGDIMSDFPCEYCLHFNGEKCLNGASEYYGKDVRKLRPIRCDKYLPIEYAAVLSDGGL